MSLGENIYKLRTAKRMSQEDFAAAMEVSRQSVSKWENNMAVPELEKLIKMAKLFEVSLDELVGNAAPSKAESGPGAPVPPAPAKGMNAKEAVSFLLLICASILPPLILMQHHTPVILAPMIPPIATIVSAYLAPKTKFLFQAYLIYHAILSFFIVLSPVGFGLGLFNWGCMWFWNLKGK